MTKIVFITSDDTKYEVDVPVGTSILEAAHSNGVPLEGACEGSLACSTCHVILEEAYYKQLPEAEEDEEDMLDLAFGLTPTSRLGCQIIVAENLEGMVLRIPSKTRNED
jgi:2Fe-2S ferredoxin